MATSHLKGSARLEYTPVGGSPVTHILAVPLSPVREIVPSRRRQRYVHDALSKRHREVVVVGAGAEEALVTIRLDNQPAALMALLQNAIESNLTVDYFREESAEAVPLKVWNLPGTEEDETTVIGDRGRYGGGDWETQVVFRRVDGGSISDMFSDE